MSESGTVRTLEGKGAVVTGGSRGIGRAIVQRLAAEGASVLFNYARSADQAATVQQAVAVAGGRARGMQADLRDPEAADALMAQAQEYLGGLDVLVNNAALDFTSGLIADTEAEMFDVVMGVNARSAFLTMRHAARTMRDGGRIINVSTLNTTRPGPKSALYAASKGALEQLTKVAAIELGSRGITVNAVCPGATDTTLLWRNNPGLTPEEVAKGTPLGRVGQPADIADFVALLAGPDARWITGQVIGATGGMG